MEKDEEERRRRLEAEEDERLVQDVFSKVPMAGPSSAIKPLPPADSNDSANSTSDHEASTSEAPPPPTVTVTVKRKATARPDMDDFTFTKPNLPSTSKPAGEPAAKRKKNDLASSLGIKIKKKTGPAVKSLV